jgi:hypothetical protein
MTTRPTSSIENTIARGTARAGSCVSSATAPADSKPWKDHPMKASVARKPKLMRNDPSPAAPIESKMTDSEFSRWNSSRIVPITRLARISAVMLIATTTLSSLRPMTFTAVATARMRIASRMSVPFDGSSIPIRSARKPAQM